MTSASVESNRRSPRVTLAGRIGLVFAGLGIGIALAETGMRLFVPVCEMPFVRYLDEYQILTYDPTLKREGTYTAGPRSEVKGRWRINNEGWNSTIDYVIEKALPRIAIIGDSYVEAFQVDLEASFPEILRERLRGQYEVYQFGISGATLAGYLRMSRYVASRFDPEILIFVVNQNDFYGSLAVDGVPSVRSRVKVDGDRVAEVAPIAYRPDPIRRRLSRSALVRYFVLNRRFGWQRKPGSTGAGKNELGMGAASGRRHQVVRMLEYILSRMVEENPTRRIVIVHDGARRAIYRGEASSEYRVLWSRAIETLAKTLSFEYLDLHGPMERRFGLDGKRFSSMHDYHWNERGHDLVAEQLVGQLLQPATGSGIP